MNRRNFVKPRPWRPPPAPCHGMRPRRRAPTLSSQNRAAEPAAHLDHHHVVQPVSRHAAHHATRATASPATAKARPIVRYHEDAEGAHKAVEVGARPAAVRRPDAVRQDHGRGLQAGAGRVGRQGRDRYRADGLGGHRSWASRSTRYFGLDPKDAPLTTFSIGIDTPEITKQKTPEAADYPVLKVKVGLATDEPTIEAVRSVTKKPLRVDANEGWKDKEEAVRKINWLEKQGVEFIEQPLPAEMIEETRWVRSRVHIPIIADEACQHASDIPKLKEAFDGVNVKLDKSGGMLEAYRMIADRQVAGHEDHAGLHDFEFGHRDRRGASFAAGGLRRSRRQPADQQRPVPRRAGGKRQADSALEGRAGTDAGLNFCPKRCGAGKIAYGRIARPHQFSH